MFDYLGNLIGFIYVGQNGIKLKWNGLARCARDKNNQIYSKKSATLISQAHKQFVNPLFEFRSDVIHYRMNTSGAERSLNHGWYEPQEFLSFSIPNRLAKLLKVDQTSDLDENTFLNSCTFLVEKSFESTNEILGIVNSNLKSDLK